MRVLDFSEKMEREEKLRPLCERQGIEFLNIRIGEIVKIARLQEGLTQSQLAKRVGTKQPSIARLESGKTAPSLSFLNEIAKALDTYLVEPRFKSVEHFYGDDVVTSTDECTCVVFENMQDARNYVSICNMEDLNLKN